MSVNFGELDFYSGGFNLPEGNYCVFFEVKMHQGTKNDGTPAGPERLGIMLHCYPIGEDGTPNGADPMDKFLALGSKAHLTYAPDPDSADANGWCKSLAVVPGGPGQQPNNQTNWSLFLKSLYDCAMPKGVFTNDISTIDGVWAHLTNVPEPEERKGFGQATGEVEQQQRPRNSTIPIATAILEGGKPWEGTGGLLEAKPAAKAKPAPVKPGVKAVAPKPGPKAVAPKAAPVAAAVDTGGMDEEDIKAAALDAIAEVLGDSPNGIAKLVLRTKTFSIVKGKSGEALAKAVADTVFGDDAVLGAVLADAGYSIQGAQVKPAA